MNNHLEHDSNESQIGANPSFDRPFNPNQSQGETAPSVEKVYAAQEYQSWIIFWVLLLAVIAGYWNALEVAKGVWSHALYSHGWLIPVIAVVLLWLRKEPYRPFPNNQRWFGVGLLLSSLLFRLLMAHFGLESLNHWTFVPAVASLFLIAGGWPMFRWGAPVAFILFFMFPLPWTFEVSLLAPMQEWATMCSNFMLQTLGFESYRTGNVINIADVPMNVVDACSGLRMTTIFLALSISLVLIAQREWWENLIILLCAIPIALIVNITRITVTGIGYSIFGVGGTTEKLIHDWSGFAMVPMALILLWAILQLLTLLFYEVDTNTQVSLFSQTGFGSSRRRIH